MYTTKEAIKYLREKWGPQGVNISVDTFYHAVTRSQQTFTRVQAGKAFRLRYTQDQLDSLMFYGNKGQRSYRPRYDHMLIKTTQDLQQLKERYGELVDEEGLIELIYAKYKIRYNRQAIRTRLHRGALDYAGYSIKGKRNFYWFPVDQLEKLRFFSRGKKH